MYRGTAHYLWLCYCPPRKRTNEPPDIFLGLASPPHTHSAKAASSTTNLDKSDSLNMGAVPSLNKRGLHWVHRTVCSGSATIELSDHPPVDLEDKVAPMPELSTDAGDPSDVAPLNLDSNMNVPTHHVGSGTVDGRGITKHPLLTRLNDVSEQDKSSRIDERPDLEYHWLPTYEAEGQAHSSKIMVKGLDKVAGSDVKKRRGRSAPPERCLSCNRAETLVWRRGPDGVKMLCNACGLRMHLNMVLYKCY